MLELKKGIDILAEAGGVKTIDEARAIFQEKLNDEHRGRLEKIKNEEALLKIANAIALCQPDDVFITTGSPPLSNATRQIPVLGLRTTKRSKC